MACVENESGSGTMSSTVAPLVASAMTKWEEHLLYRAVAQANARESASTSLICRSGVENPADRRIFSQVRRRFGGCDVWLLESRLRIAEEANRKRSSQTALTILMRLSIVRHSRRTPVAIAPF
jgi:hypothetical protein